MKTRLIDNLKIIAALAIAFVIVQIFSQTVFLFNTPRLNYFFLAKLFPKKSSSKNLLTTPLSAMTPLAPGVYAKEDKELKTVYIRLTKDARWEEKIIEADGKKIRILYPKSVF